MTLDTPERVKYFGLRNMRSCGICRVRKGRSLTRQSTRHHPQHIDNLYHEANVDARTRPTQRRRKRHRQQLKRHGFAYNKRCRLGDHAKHSLVHIPKFQPTLFGGLYRHEAMHVYFIGFCSWTLENLAACVSRREVNYVTKMVKSCHQFRDPTTGAVFPRLCSLLDLTSYTAEKRVLAVFYWAHVLGLRAAVIEEPCRLHAQLAVVNLQLLLISTRGHRSYTAAELQTVFKDVGRQFFIHLEALLRYVDDERVSKEQFRHDRHPDKNPAPTPYVRADRYTREGEIVDTYTCIICLSMYCKLFTIDLNIIHVNTFIFTDRIPVPTLPTQWRQTSTTHGEVEAFTNTAEKGSHTQ